MHKKTDGKAGANENRPDACEYSRKRLMVATTHVSSAIWTQEPDQRWSIDLCLVWDGQDYWLRLALVMDWYTRELLSWQLSKTGKTSIAVSVLEHVLITDYTA